MQKSGSNTAISTTGRIWKESDAKMGGGSPTGEGFAQSLEKKLMQLGQTAAEEIGRILGEGKSGCWIKEKDTCEREDTECHWGTLTAVPEKYGEEQNLCEGLRPNAASCSGTEWCGQYQVVVVEELCGRESFPTIRLGVRMASTDPCRDPEESRSWGFEDWHLLSRVPDRTWPYHVICWLLPVNVMGPLQRDLSSKLKWLLCGICLKKDSIVCVLDEIL